MRIDTEHISVIRKTKGKLPSLPFVELAHTILGKKYELCIAFVNDAESRTLNNTHRQKDYPTNVLSFPYTDTSGDIFINLKKVRSDAPLFEKSYDEFLLHILVHGLLHLKGYDHGEEMDRLEEKYIKKFS
ncbi:MAG: hypothetical protein RI996_66 [Candidatus Parcubacteria bacterium]|jgi:probable rRNA maturation factor